MHLMSISLSRSSQREHTSKSELHPHVKLDNVNDVQLASLCAKSSTSNYNDTLMMESIFVYVASTSFRVSFEHTKHELRIMCA